MSTAAIIEPVQSSSVLLPGLRLRDSATIHTEEDLPEVHQASPNWLLALTDKTKIQQAVPPPSIAEEVSVSTSTIPDRSIYLINSPYTEPEHQLDLSTLDSQNQLLAQALAVLASATSSFATTPYQESLNWATVFSELKALVSSKGHNWTKQDFYVVEFRSKLKADIDKPLLFKLDKESHREATASGGLLKYWFGQPDAERRNLATCECFPIYLC